MTAVDTMRITQTWDYDDARADRSVDTPPGEATLITRNGAPYQLWFACPCGQPDEGRGHRWGGSACWLDLHSPDKHRLISADPLHVEASVGHYHIVKRVRPDGSEWYTRASTWCHFFIRGGRVEWCAN